MTHRIFFFICIHVVLVFRFRVLPVRVEVFERIFPGGVVEMLDHNLLREPVLVINFRPWVWLYHLSIELKCMRVGREGEGRTAATTELNAVTLPRNVFEISQYLCVHL